jgi:hypothetical protein
MVHRIAFVITFALIVALTACQDASELPTLAPTLEPLSDRPTKTPLPPTATLTPAAPTATLTPSATPVVLTPQPTALDGPGVNITSPTDESEILLGSEIVVSGLVQSGLEHDFLITLSSATGHVLAEARPVVNELNSWQATLKIPHSISGRAEFNARLIGADGLIVASDVLPVMLEVDPDGTDRYLILERPDQAEEAVAGYNIFFDGLAQQPVDSLVTISLWNEACQNRVARQSFRLRGSGYWQGFVIVPVEASGRLCAMAHFGEPGNESWREAQVEIDILPPGDEQAMSIMVGNPPPESKLVPGQSLLLYGTAYNATGREILVSILLENGRLLTEGVTEADIYGYWEMELFIPASATGPAQIEASFGERSSDEFAQSTVSVLLGE